MKWGTFPTREMEEARQHAEFWSDYYGRLSAAYRAMFALASQGAILLARRVERQLRYSYLASMRAQRDMVVKHWTRIQSREYQRERMLQCLAEGEAMLESGQTPRSESKG